jgi:hypothetical protein
MRGRGDKMSAGSRFSTPGQTGPGTNRTSYTMASGSFHVAKRQIGGVEPHPSPPPPQKKIEESNVEVKQRLEQISILPLGFHGYYMIKFTFLFGTFIKIRKVTISVVMCVCPSFRTEQLDSLLGGF